MTLVPACAQCSVHSSDSGSWDLFQEPAEAGMTADCCVCYGEGTMVAQGPGATRAMEAPRKQGLVALGL